MGPAGRALGVAGWLALAAAVGLGGCAGQGGHRAAMAGFAATVAQRHGFEPAALRRLLASAVIRDEVLAKISRPAEAMPWHRYRLLLLDDARVAAGVAFWSRHAATLAEAERRYGVPAQIIVAIIGVETSYGRHTGRHRVLDALATLAFAYPPRAAFFQSELEQFLLLCRELRLNPGLVVGSYAGAMGRAQFMPSSYRHYAVDFDGDGRADLLHGWADVIASVAHYLACNQWRPGQPVAVPLTAAGDAYKAKLTAGLKPDLRLAELESANLTMNATLPSSAKIKILELDQGQSVELWAALDNFYAITRYNHSALYAMAVYQLSQLILAKQGQFYEQADNDADKHCALRSHWPYPLQSCRGGAQAPPPPPAPAPCAQRP